ncbi:MAG: HAD-IA family hydrolase [Pseudomonadota bacterium]
MTHLLLGSIGVLAETSEMQRDCFNAAFQEAGLDWHWSREVYAELLKTSGGRDRIARFAAERGENVDADAVHRRKSELFQQKLKEGLPLRDGVADALDRVKAKGGSVAFVTSTSPDNVDAILSATGLTRGDFDVVIDAESTDASKPDPAPYHRALEDLRIAPKDAFAVEDNPDGFAAARSAGLPTIAFPGVLHEASDFDGAIATQSTLSIPD